MSAQQPTVTGLELLLAFDNAAAISAGAGATATSTATGTGSLLGDHRPEHLLSPSLDMAWRSGSLAELLGRGGTTITITITLGSPRAVDWIGLHRHNVVVPWRVELFRADPATGAPAIWGSPWTDPIIRASLSDYGWYDLAWMLGPSDRQVAAWASLYRLDSWISLSAPEYGVTHARLAFDVAGGTNGAADYLQAAWLFVGQAYRPSYNMQLGWSLSIADRTTAVRTEGGSLRGRRRSSGRRLSFALPYLGSTVDGREGRAEAYERLLTGYLREHGTLGLCFAWPEPAIRRHYYDQAMLATAVELPAIASEYHHLPSARGWVLEETE